jgi:hypothetical protein
MHYMKQLYFLVVFSISILFLSFSKHKEFSINDLVTPPGTTKISDNLYMDQTEIRTLDYLEFLHWTRRVYGENSEDYKTILPDTSVWSALGKSYEKFSGSYLRNPAFRNYPIVGISFIQARQFCKWRSDRVMEFMLIRDGVFKHNPYPTKDSVFTIEKYVSGKYGKFSELKELQYYPEYSLPDSETFIKTLAFADSLNNSFQNFKNKKETREMITPYFKEDVKGTNDTLLFGEIPLRPHSVNFYYHSLFRTYINKLIIDLKGNAAELTSVEGIAFGGSYMDSSVFIDNKLFSKISGANCFTGFRNVCRYKKLKI